MKRIRLHILAASLLACVSFAGCQGLAPSTIRAQSPEPAMASGVEQTGHRYHQPVKATISELQDCYHEHHNTDTTYYPPHGGAGLLQNHGVCPPGAAGWCPNGSCPPGGYAGYSQGMCQPGHCQGGNQFDWYPKHGYSYSYQRPNDLVYPPQGGVGGAVVYPYYTHRGPSDFFRAE